MENDIEINDKEELKKQMEKYIYDKGEYLEVKVLVGHGETTPIAEFHGRNIDAEDIARCICSLKDIICKFVKECPEAITLASFMQSTDYNVLFDKGEKDEK